MKREIIKIDEEVCNGCGECVPNCHEGALQIIDGKARLVSELMCDGLGACIGHCPLNALTIEYRDAEDYNETAVIKEMIPNGANTIIAHLTHLKEHGEHTFLKEAISYLESSRNELPFNLDEVKKTVHGHYVSSATEPGCGGGCPSTLSQDFRLDLPALTDEKKGSLQSELKQWPVQLHLVNPSASFFQKADLLIAADCIAFAKGDFHTKDLKGKALAIACPKLDHGQEVYLNKLVSLIDNAMINTITVMIMEVPCCGGLLRLVQQATQIAQRKVPVKASIISTKGNVLSEEWV